MAVMAFLVAVSSIAVMAFLLLPQLLWMAFLVALQLLWMAFLRAGFFVASRPGDLFFLWCF